MVFCGLIRYSLKKGQTVIYRKVFLASMVVTSFLFGYGIALSPNNQVEVNQEELSPERLLSMIAVLEPSKLYTVVSQDEIIAAAKEDREPKYLGLIHKAYGIQVKEFVRGLSVGESREQKMRHGINMINLMSAVLDTAWYAILNTESDVAWHSDLYAAKGAAWSSAVSDPGARFVSWHALLNTATAIARGAEKEFLSTIKDLSNQEISRLAYRVAEITVLLFFFVCF
jgi:hypothetical protein